MAWNNIRRLADAIANDVRSGLRGYHQNMSMSIEQLEQEIVEMRLLIIKEYIQKGLLPAKDLLMSINCVPVDCDTLDKCPCNRQSCGEPTAHFQIPQLLLDYGQAIEYVGSTDRQHKFLVYTKAINRINTYQKYRKRGKNKPWVYIDITPNSEGLLDCYIFGAPLIKQVSVVAIFKDPRQLEDYQCDCNSTEDSVTAMDSNFNFIDSLIKDKLTKQKLQYYRQYAAPIIPNNQQHAAG